MKITEKDIIRKRLAEHEKALSQFLEEQKQTIKITPKLEKVAKTFNQLRNSIGIRQKYLYA